MKNNLHTNKSFEDLAWQNMSSILDEYMPVREEKQRPLFWIWGAASAIIIALAGLWYMNGAGSNTSNFSENTNSNKTVVTSKSIANNPHSNDSKLATVTQQSTTETTKSTITNTSVAQSKNATTRTVNNTSPVALTSTKGEFLEVKNNTPLNNTQAINSEGNLNEKDYVATQTKTNTPIIASLPSNPLKPINIDMTDLGISRLSMSSIKGIELICSHTPPKNFIFSGQVGTGLDFTQNKNIFGFISLNGQWRLNQSLSAGLGLGYLMHFVDYTLSLSSGKELQLLNTHYGLLSVNLKYKIAPSFSLFSGIESNFLINAKGKFTENNLKGPSENVDLEIFDRIRLNPFVGIEYRIDKTWAIQTSHFFDIRSKTAFYPSPFSQKSSIGLIYRLR